MISPVTLTWLATHSRLWARYRTACTHTVMLAVAWLAFGTLCLPPQTLAEPLKLGGTGAALGTMQRLLEALQQSDPTFRLTIVPSLGSSGGLKALEAGALDIAVISRALTPAEAARGLVAREYGKTPFLLATNKPGMTGLTLQQVADIYAGTHTTWPDGTPIRLVLRPAADVDSGLLAAFSPAVKQSLALAMAKEGMVVAMTDQDSAKDLVRLPGSLGTTSLAILLSEGHALTPLALDGRVPSVATLADGTYPYFKPLFVVTKGAPTGEVARFLNFLFSPAGHQVLSATGHWSASAAPQVR